MTSFLPQTAFLILTGILSSAQAQCIVRSTDEVPLRNQPLYISNNQLLYPELIHSKPQISVKSGRNLTVACPGRDNRVSNGSQVERVKCMTGKLFLMQKGGFQATYTLRDITCRDNAKSCTTITSKFCGPPAKAAKIVEVGFKLGNEWLKLFEICHSFLDSFTYYASHKLNYLAKIGSQKNTHHQSFKKSTSAYVGLDPITLYKKEKQRDMMERYLGTDRYIDPSSRYLSKGHLVPHADFIFNTWQFATYYYINSAPQWMSHNSGNWLSVETAVRNLASKLGMDLDIVTGTSGTLHLEDINGNLRPIYLDPNVKKIPVPRLFWKSVYYPSGSAGIVFLMENNPFDQGTPLCRDICRANGWIFNTNLQRGMVYCCSQADLRTANFSLPSYSASSILKNAT